MLEFIKTAIKLRLILKAIGRGVRELWQKIRKISKLLDQINYQKNYEDRFI